MTHSSMKARNGSALTRLADPASCQTFRVAVPIRGGYGGIGHPGLIFIVSSWGQRVAKERPLKSVILAVVAFQIGGDVPPLDPELRMRAVIGGELKARLRVGQRVSFAGCPKPREPLSKGRAGKKQQKDQSSNAQWQTPGSSQQQGDAPTATRARGWPRRRRRWRGCRGQSNPMGRGTSADASRRPPG